MSFAELDAKMRNRWTDFLCSIGIDKKFLVNRPGPCPLCGGTDRFRYDNKEGKGTYFCNQCQKQSGSGFDLALFHLRCTWAELAQRLEAMFPDLKTDAPQREHSPDQKRDSMRSLWRAGTRLDGKDPASRYLTARCGSAPVVPALRFVEECFYNPGPGLRASKHPAMLAAVQAPDDKLVGLHRTYLTARGTKAQVREAKKTMGELPDGCAIRLAPVAEHMAVAEGIEKALSVTAMFQLPCWSLINAGRLAVWTPPDGVKRVSIYGDNDGSFTGHAAAYALAKRLRSAKVEVEVHLPPNAGEDWSDIHASLASDPHPQRAETA